MDFQDNRVVLIAGENERFLQKPLLLFSGSFSSFFSYRFKSEKITYKRLQLAGCCPTAILFSREKLRNARLLCDRSLVSEGILQILHALHQLIFPVTALNLISKQVQ